MMLGPELDCTETWCSELERARKVRIVWIARRRKTMGGLERPRAQRVARGVNRGAAVQAGSSSGAGVGGVGGGKRPVGRGRGSVRRGTI